MSQFGALRLTSQQSQIDPHRSVSEIIMTVRSSAKPAILEKHIILYAAPSRGSIGPLPVKIDIISGGKRRSTSCCIKLTDVVNLKLANVNHEN